MLEHTDYTRQLMVVGMLTLEQPVVLFWESFRVHDAWPPREFRSLIGIVL